MTVEELLAAVNATKMSKEDLVKVLGASWLLVQREEYRSREAAIRAEATKAAQAYEEAAQAEHAKYLAIEAALQTP